MWASRTAWVSTAVALQVLLVSTGPPGATGTNILDAFLPGPPELWEIGFNQLKEQVYGLTDFFNSRTLIVKLKDEYKGHLNALSADDSKLATDGIAAESQVPTSGLEVLELKDGFDVISLFFQLRDLDIFEFVSLDFKHSLTDGEGKDQEEVNAARRIWQELNVRVSQFVTRQESKDEAPSKASLEIASAPPAGSQPEDSNYFRQWGLKAIGMDVTWPLLKASPGVDSRNPHFDSVNQDNREIIVAVIDTGVDYNHPDLQGKMWVNQAERDGLPGVDDDGNGCIDDIYGCNVVGQRDGVYDVMDDVGHGTHCAGSIAAVHNNSLGIAGVAPNVKIMAVKIFANDGSGFDSDAIRGIDYAIRMGAQISSNSWSVRSEDRIGIEPIEAAVRASYEAGQVFVAAAGNSGRDMDIVEAREYPAGLNEPNIISVMALDEESRLASFAGYGMGDLATNYGKFSVDIAAPGMNIYSTLPGGTWGFKSGTSMAVPFVAGVAAVVYEDLFLNGNFTGATPQDRALLTKAVILYSSLFTPQLKDRCVTEGRLNAYGSIVAGRLGMTGATSTLLFQQPPEPSSSILSTLQNWWHIIAACAAALGVTALFVCVCCCCHHCQGSSSRKYSRT